VPLGTRPTLRSQVDVVEGLENAPDALDRLFTGEIADASLD
jgi:NADPH-dependent curcumin reductase CurA